MIVKVSNNSWMPSKYFIPRSMLSLLSLMLKLLLLKTRGRDHVQMLHNLAQPMSSVTQLCREFVRTDFVSRWAGVPQKVLQRLLPIRLAIRLINLNTFMYG